jgi:hypothetical protein
MTSPATHADAADTAELALARSAIDAAVLRAGDRLAACAGTMNRHSGLLETLPRDLQSAELEESCAALSRIGERAQDVVGAFADERAAMEALLMALAASASPIADLERSVRTIGILSVNARVVAAELGEVEGFEVFTIDIDRLSREAGATVSRFSDLFLRLRSDLRTVAERRNGFESTHSATLSGLRAKLARRLEKVDERRRTAADISRRTSETVRQIAGRIGAVVMSLQSGDRMRQRIEHVEQALASPLPQEHDANGAGNTLPADATGDHPDIRRVHADALRAQWDALRALQAEQLAAAVDEFDPQLAEAEQALGGLARDALDILREAVALTGSASRYEEAPIAALGRELEAATALLGRCALERGELDALANRVAEAVAELLTHVEAVQDVEAEMRILSLNAAVKCSQLGNRGRALNVVAQQLRDLTVDTVTSADAAVEALRGAAAVAVRLQTGGRADLAGELGQIEETAQSAVTLLRAIETRTAEAVETLRTEGPTMSRKLASAAADIADARAHAARLNRSAATLAQADAPGSAVDDDALVASLLATLERLRQGYTMEDERRIHDDFAARVAARRAARRG